jgi:hypothetical protein
MNSDKLIKLAFDIQKFIKNDHLQSVIDPIGAKYGLLDGCNELSDEEIEVWAAGDPSLGQTGKHSEKKDGK